MLHASPLRIGPGAGAPLPGERGTFLPERGAALPGGNTATGFSHNAGDGGEGAGHGAVWHLLPAVGNGQVGAP